MTDTDPAILHAKANFNYGKPSLIKALFPGISGFDALFEINLKLSIFFVQKI